MKVQAVVNSLRTGCNGRTQQINLGDWVRDRKTGRVGRTTQVLRDRLFVRWEGAERVAYVYRESVDSVRYLRAQGECIEDDANAEAFRAEMDRQYAMVGWTDEMAQAEREAEARAFLSDPDYRRFCGHEECDMEPCSLRPSEADWSLEAEMKAEARGIELAQSFGY